MERFLFRPGIAPRARYYAIVFLNQLQLSHDDARGDFLVLSAPLQLHGLQDLCDMCPGMGSSSSHETSCCCLVTMLEPAVTLKLAPYGSILLTYGAHCLAQAGVNLPC